MLPQPTPHDTTPSCTYSDKTVGAVVVGDVDGYSVPPGSALGAAVGHGVGRCVGPRLPQSVQSVPNAQRE